MSKTWIRLHVAFLDNPKVMRLPLAERGLWFGLLAVTARCDRDGYLPSPDDCAWMLHMEEQNIYPMMDVLAEARLIEPTASGYRIHDWYQWQVRERLPAHEWKIVRRRILERDEYTCQYCGAREPTMHVDHVIPVSRGGSNDDENLVTACSHCNLSKSATALEDWRG